MKYVDLYFLNCGYVTTRQHHVLSYAFQEINRLQKMHCVQDIIEKHEFVRNFQEVLTTASVTDFLSWRRKRTSSIVLLYTYKRLCDSPKHTVP